MHSARLTVPTTSATSALSTIPPGAAVTPASGIRPASNSARVAASTEVRILAIPVVQLGHVGRVDTLEVVSLHGSGLELSPIAELYREIRPSWPQALDSGGL